MTNHGSEFHNPAHSPQDSRIRPWQNTDHGTALHYINSHYHGSSHSLADTQFTDDPPKFDWDLPTDYKIHQDVAIISRPHLPRSQPQYYLPQLGDPNRAPSTSSPAHHNQSHSEPDPYSSVAATARPDWRADAIASGRAGSYYDYSLHPDHLRDRLFFQGFVIPPDAALQGATTAAIQDFEALGKEVGLLKASVEEKEGVVMGLRQEVKEKESCVRALRQEIKGLQKALGMLKEEGDESDASQIDGEQSF